MFLKIFYQKTLAKIIGDFVPRTKLNFATSRIQYPGPMLKVFRIFSQKWQKWAILPPKRS
jgi:hypothetical protein